MRVLWVPALLASAFTWTVENNKDCDAKFGVTVYNVDFKAALCSWSSATNPAVCGDAATLKALCESIDACHSVTVVTGGDEAFGYLNYYNCGVTGALNDVVAPVGGEAQWTTSDVYIKVHEAPTSCSVGEGAKVVGGDYSSVQGSYTKASAGLYEQDGGLSKVSWHVSQCGWVVSRRTLPNPETAASTPGCTDQNELVSALFGTDEADACGTAGAWTSTAAYCANSIFAALCSSTCGTDCTKDPMTDADQVTFWTGVGAQLGATADPCTVDKCNAYASLAEGLDTIVCPSCGGSSRRLTESSRQHGERIRADFRRSMQDLTLRTQIAARGGYGSVRRLGWENQTVSGGLDYEELYYTFESADGCGAGTSADDAAMGTLYDVYKYHSGIPIALAPACTTVGTYTTTADTYCSRRNVAVQYSSNADVVNNACVAKCGATITDAADAAGYLGHTWCNGNTGFFMADTNALCLPREECERLCTALGPEKCVGIDMHRSSPRCYLNSPKCNEDADAIITNTTWDHLQYVAVTSADAAATSFVWTTKTGKYCFENQTWGAGPTLVDGDSSRKNCEDYCSNHSDCGGFQFNHTADVPVCLYFNASGCMGSDPEEVTTYDEATNTWTTVESLVAGADYAPFFAGDVQTVFRTAVPACTVTVSGSQGAADPRTSSNDIGTAANFDGVYTRIASDEYLRADNLTRFKYTAAAAPASPTDNPGCDSWTVQVNGDPVTEVTLANCTDNGELALAFLTSYASIADTVVPRSTHWQAEPKVVLDLSGPASTDHSAFTITAATAETKYACQFGADRNACTNAVFAGLCAHTCTELQARKVAVPGPWHFFQDPVVNETSDSTCSGNNNDAAKAFVQDYLSGSAEASDIWYVNHLVGTAAGDWCNTTALLNYTETKAACSSQTWSAMFTWICKESCALYNTPPDDEPANTTVHPDETHEFGAMNHLNQRRLGGYSLNDVTTSGRQWQPTGVYATVSSYTVEYLEGNSTGLAWSSVLQSYKNGSRGVAWEDQFSGAREWPFPYEEYVCPSQAAVGSADSYAQLDRPSMFRINPPQAGAELQYVCSDQAPCPEFTTCYVTQSRFVEEQDGTVGSLLPSSTLAALEGTNQPRVIATDYKAVGLFSLEAALWQGPRGGGGDVLTPYPPQILTRKSWGAPRVRVDGLGSTGDQVYVSATSLTADGYYAADDGVTLPTAPTGWEWATDMITVSAATGGIYDLSASVKLELGAGTCTPDASFKLYQLVGGDYVDAGPADSFTVDASGIGLAVVRVTNGSYVGARTTDFCAAGPCDVHATCANTAGGAACTCDAGYKGDGTQCYVDPASVAGSDYYLRITHGSSLTKGWRVGSVQLFSDSACSAPLAGLYDGADPVLGQFPSETNEATFTHITSQTRVYTGKYGYSHYPWYTDSTSGTFKYWNKNIFDGPESWRSECLQCSADAPTSIEFIVKASKNVGCVRIVQEDGFASKDLTVERGPAEGVDCGMATDQTRCAASSTWTSKSDAPSRDVPLGCGTPNLQILGEIMTATGSYAGSYASNVPTSCACHQLCADHIGGGCRSWKFVQTAGLNHCYLQRNIFGSGEGYYGTDKKWPSTAWTAGLAPLSLLSHSSDPATPASGESFTLTLSGASLPYSANKAEDGSELQRVKLVSAGDACSVKVPKEVSGLSCIASRRKGTTVHTLCGPKPSAATADTVSFGPVKVNADAAGKSYDVCYCPFDCFKPGRWRKVGGELAVAASVFTWEGADVERDAATISVTVRRPAFGSHSSQADWRVKLVRDYFTCEEELDQDVFQGTVSISSDSCATPDECVFTSTPQTGMAAGRFMVCFNDGTWSQLPATDGRQVLTVNRLATDSVAPRGIFHNQRFSVLAGEAKSVEVKGSRIPVPSNGRVTLSKGACGSLSEYVFDGSFVAPKSTDTTPPVLDNTKTSPADSSTVAPASVTVKMTNLIVGFSEPVTLDNCVGSFLIYADGTLYSETACAAATAVDYRVIVPINDVSSTPPGTGDAFTFAVETGAVADMAGNQITYATSTHSWLVDGADAVAPSVVYTVPQDKESSDLITANRTVKLVFSEEVAVQTGEIVLVWCGTDFVCDADDRADRTVSAYSVATDVSDGTTLTLALGTVVRDFQKYELTFPASSVQDAAGNAGPAADYRFEFTVDSSGFAGEKSVSPAAAGSSNGDELALSVHVGAETAAGDYRLCYCDATQDLTLQDLGDGQTTYTFTENIDCPTNGVASSDAGWNSVTTQLHGKDVTEHYCTDKCSQGCTGEGCYCGGYSSTTSANALCLPKASCATACDLLGTNCAGFEVHEDADICYVFASGTPCSDAANKKGLFTKQAGTACTHFTDFTEEAGQVTVTGRVQVSVDYVVSPGKATSLELTNANGQSLTYATGISADRITVIDCGGACGVSSPTSSVSLGPGLDASKIGTWAQFAPANMYEDAAHADAQNPEDTSLPDVQPSATHYTYASLEGRYVDQHNLRLDQHSVNIGGVARDLAEFGCYKKCSVPCTDAHCQCDGYYSWYDTAASNAICAEEEVCKQLCDGIAACGSVDMKDGKPRCFLNDAQGDVHVDTAAVSSNGYTLLVKELDPNAESRRLAHDLDIPTTDLGYSWSELLRFKELTFTTGGTFKLCFCDSSLLGGAPCSTEKHFNVEVGLVHASGVQCLVSKPQLQRASCAQMQGDSGLRCYSHMDAPTPSAPALAADAPPAQGAGAQQGTPTQGNFGPEETGQPTATQSGNAVR